MWQQIEANKRKSFILIFAMAIILAATGYACAIYFLGSAFGINGILFALIIWLILLCVSYFQGDNIFLSMNNARKINSRDNEKLHNVVEEMSIAAGLPKVPDIYIIDDPSPNAFAVGRKPETASVAVTAGLLEILNRDELQGVIAHEIAHIKNRDTLYMLFASIMLSAIVLLADIFFRSGYRSSGRRYNSRNNSSSGNNAEAILLLISVIFLILAPIIAQLVYFSISRKREYLADACAAQFTRYPVALANALAKISGTTIKMKDVNQFSAPLYIINPLAFNKEKMSFDDLTSTHPSTESRIKILYKMAGADIIAYNKAYKQVNGSKGEKLFNHETLQGIKPLSIIGTKEQKNDTTEGKIERRRETEDMLWKMNNYIFKECECGTKIKAPECYRNKTIICPHCKKEIQII